MARPLRIEFPGAVYHVTSRGNARGDIFLAEADRSKFLDVLADIVEKYNWLCHAYCLLDNHYHLLIETPDPNLSLGMRQLNGVYTQAFNRAHQRVGHVFQGRYKAILVEKDSHLLELCRYVVLNPVRAGMASKPAEWKWSSYKSTAFSGNAPDFLTIDWILGQFAPKKTAARQQYRKFVADGVASDRGDILTAGMAGLVAGALSMGAGEYVSVSTQRDAEVALIAEERRQLAEMPEEELEQLEGFLESAGMSPAVAAMAAQELTERDPLRAHAQLEYGINVDEVTNPWAAAGASILAFTLGALLPVLTILLPEATRIGVTLGAVVVALSVTGFVSARLGYANPRRAAIRNVAGGTFAMVVTYGVGLLLGTRVG